MRVSSCAAAAAMFAFVSSAHPREMFTPNGPCFAFCDPAPTPTPVPSPTVQATADKKPDEPRILHRQRHRFVAASGVGKVRFWRQVRAGRASAAYVRTRAALAAAPQTLVAAPHPVVSTPPASPAAALAAPTPQIAPSPSELKSAVAAASPVSNGPPTVEPLAAPVEPGPDHAARLLAQAFSQQQQQAVTTAEPPKASPPKPENPSASSPRAAATVIPARSSGAVEVTPNGLHVTWWPENFPDRAAIWSGALLLVAASAFRIARASGRRLQS
jgi:hypothetical protein